MVADVKGLNNEEKSDEVLTEAKSTDSESQNNAPSATIDTTDSSCINATDASSVTVPSLNSAETNGLADSSSKTNTLNIAHSKSQSNPGLAAEMENQSIEKGCEQTNFAVDPNSQNQPQNQSDPNFSSDHLPSAPTSSASSTDHNACGETVTSNPATAATGSVQSSEYYDYQYYGVPPTDPNYAYAYQNYYAQYGQLPPFPTAPPGQIVNSPVVPAHLPAGYPVVGASFPYGTQYPVQTPVPAIQSGVQAPHAVGQPSVVPPDPNSTPIAKESASESAGAESDDDPTVLKGKPSTKKNNTLPFRGDEKTMNLNNLIYTNIIQSPYFKNDLYTLKTYHEVIDEIYREVRHLEPWERGSRRIGGQTGMCGSVRGVGAGGIVSTAFCCLYKLYTLKLTRKQLNGLIKHKDSPYIRGLGFMYIRYTQPPPDLWSWYEPFLDDEEQLDVKAGGGHIMSIGEMTRHMLLKLDWFSTLFPRIPVPIQKDIAKKLAEYDEKKRIEKGIEDGEIEDDEEEEQGSTNQDKNNKGAGDKASKEREKWVPSKNQERSGAHQHSRSSRPTSPVKDIKERDRDRGKDRNKDRDRHRDTKRRSKSTDRDKDRDYHRHHERHAYDDERDRTKRHRESGRDRDREKDKQRDRDRDRERNRERHRKSRSKSHDRVRRRSRSRSKEKHSSSKHSHREPREAHGHRSRH